MGCGNMGDAAVHESFIYNINKRLPNARLIAFSQNPEDTRERHNIACYPIRWSDGRNCQEEGQSASRQISSRFKSFIKRYNVLYALAKPIRILFALGRLIRDSFRELKHLRRSYTVVKSLNVLVIAGGGQLCDLWRDQPYNVFKFCVLAKLAKRRVFIVGVGADLIRGPVNRFFSRWAVRFADYACFRDVESQALIRRLGARTKTTVCPDPAYGLNIGDYEIVGPAISARAKVGLNPMGFCDPRMWPRQNAGVYNRYLDKLAVFASWLLSQNYDLELFTSDVGVDRYAIDDLRERIRGAVSAELYGRITCPFTHGLRGLVFEMSTFDFVVTSKFHGVVFCHLLAKPVIALSYLPKIDYLMHSVGHDRYCLDVEHFDVDTLIVSFKALAYNANDVKRLFRREAANYEEKIQAEFDNLVSNLVR